MLEKIFRNQKRKLSSFNTTAKPGTDNEESDDLEKDDGNMNNFTFTRQGKFKRSKKV